VRCDRFDADDDSEFLGLLDKIGDARKRFLEGGLAVVVGIR
jgi:hypothetical protein